MPNVLSTIKGNPCLCAISATASMSIMLLFGFPSVSINMAFVFGHIAFSKFSIDDGSTNVADISYAVFCLKKKTQIIVSSS